MAESTGLMADLYVFTHFTRRVIIIILAGSCGFVRSVRDAAAKYAQIGRLCAMLGIAAYSLNEMKGRVGAGRTRARYATRFLQPSLLRASPETPSCFAFRLAHDNVGLPPRKIFAMVVIRSKLLPSRIRPPPKLVSVCPPPPRIGPSFLSPIGRALRGCWPLADGTPGFPGTDMKRTAAIVWG